MKVLFICSGNKTDGIGTIVKNQGDSIQNSVVELKYFTIVGKGLYAYIKNIFVLKKYQKANNFDIFHAHYSLSAYTATFAGCKPLIVSLMGSDSKAGILQKSINKFLINYRWRQVIVKSDSMKRDIKAKNAIVLPNGVNLNKAMPNATISSPSKRFTILFAADPFRYAKNYTLAKKAVSLLDKKISAHFKVVHSKPQHIIIQEINSAAILLLTSHYEGSPNIIKEAMACNCPTVSTDVGDVKWLFGNEPGHFLTSFEPDDVAEKIKQALEYAKTKGRTNGRERVIKLGLDENIVSKKIINCYTDVLLKYH